MTDIRDGLHDVAQAVADLAKEAAYVAIGVGVLEFQRAQVRRHELACARKLISGRPKDFDETVAQVRKAVDANIDPILALIPEQAQAVVRQTRDELRSRLRFSA
jgi:hypothetical protein